MAEVRKHIVFHGRVQGVGFRYKLGYLARMYSVTGWATNGMEPLQWKFRDGNG